MNGMLIGMGGDEVKRIGGYLQLGRATFYDLDTCRGWIEEKYGWHYDTWSSGRAISKAVGAYWDDSGSAVLSK